MSPGYHQGQTSRVLPSSTPASHSSFDGSGFGWRDSSEALMGPQWGRGKWFSLSLTHLHYTHHPHVLFPSFILLEMTVSVRRWGNAPVPSTPYISFSPYFLCFIRHTAEPFPCAKLTGITQRALRPGGAFWNKQDIVVQELQQTRQQLRMSLDPPFWGWHALSRKADEGQEFRTERASSDLPASSKMGAWRIRPSLSHLKQVSVQESLFMELVADHSGQAGCCQVHDRRGTITEMATPD